VRREQVALDALAQEFHHLARRALLLACEPLADPGRQAKALDGPDVDHRARRAERR